MERTKRPTLRQLADERGVSVGVMLDLAIREHGTVDKAAAALGVQANTAYQWIHRNRYEVQQYGRLVKKQTA